MLGLVGCSIAKPDPLPGESAYMIDEVSFSGAEAVDPGPLRGKLSLRPSSLIAAGMPYNVYRQAEDRRRIAAYWQTFGYFDVEVDDAEVTFDEENSEADVAWTIREGEAYRIRAVEIVGAPEEHMEALRDAVIFEAGDPVDMEVYRKNRFDLSDILRRSGHMHAETYSRAFISKDAKNVDWFFYIDAGPLTHVGTVTVEGAVEVPEADVLARMGLEPGAPFDLDDKEKGELDLLDTGAYAVVHLETNADNEFVVGALPPDTGGRIPPERIAADGSLIPRELDPAIDINAVVVEAPAQQGRVGFGASVDTTRLDGWSRGEVIFRNAFGPLHHVVMEGLVGYGWLFRSTSDEPLGLYGSARVAYLRPGGLARLLDWRVEARFDERLFPGYHLHSASVGPGIRSTLAAGLFLDVDALFRYELPSALSFEDAAAAKLPESSERILGELQASIIYDQRDEPTEALDGYLLSLRSAWSPGGALGTHGYVRVEGEGRYIQPLATAFSAALRVYGGWVFDTSGEGVPLGARLFGGGAYDMRGFSAQTLSPYANTCTADGACRAVPVGGLSRFGSTLEFRWLPALKQYGLSLFVDGGSTSLSANPFEEGLSVAVGGGLDVRLWYVPLNIDFSYRVTDSEQFSALDHFFVFLRVGEAF